MKRIVLAGLLLLVCFFVTPASADVPPLPHAFYGEVEINGDPASVGKEVEARGEGVLADTDWNPITVSEAGKYGGPGGLDPKLVVQGDIEEGATITFYVDGELADTIAWHSGEVTEFDLSVTIDYDEGGGGGGGFPRDIIAPQFVEIWTTNITHNSADINIETNEKTTCQIEYWASPSILTPPHTTLDTKHVMPLTNLSPGNIYEYNVIVEDRVGNEAISEVYSFTTLGEAPAVAFSSSGLSISPGKVNLGETVTIRATVTNTGSAAGSYEVTLKIDGVVEETKEVTLKAGESQEVTFTTSRDTAGNYLVDVDGLSGSFSVKEVVVAPTPPAPPAPPPAPAPTTIPEGLFNWPLVGLIIAAVVIVALFVFFWIRRRYAA